VLDPFQTNIIVNAPGQQVATHTDAPYFWGASRFDMPQWLLAVMVHSGLPEFQRRFIHQARAREVGVGEGGGRIAPSLPAVAVAVTVRVTRRGHQPAGFCMVMVVAAA
jgi:hypothetical protein